MLDISMIYNRKCESIKFSFFPGLFQSERIHTHTKNKIVSFADKKNGSYYLICCTNLYECPISNVRMPIGNERKQMIRIKCNDILPWPEVYRSRNQWANHSIKLLCVKMRNWQLWKDGRWNDNGTKRNGKKNKNLNEWKWNIYSY